ncbi:MAG: acyl-CoA dehydrogenase family protein [Polyangia bacterium]|nr:acyl-CoA dehydrogenase family protein [Polyangia bacterium]
MEPIADSLFLSEEHHLFRAGVRRWVKAHLAPHVDAWEQAKTFPREIYREASAAGWLGVGFPEELGGSGDLPPVRSVTRSPGNDSQLSTGSGPGSSRGSYLRWSRGGARPPRWPVD